MFLIKHFLIDSLFYRTKALNLTHESRSINPVFVFDAGYHLIACNWEMANADPVGKEIVDNMGFTEKEFRLINKENHIHEKVKKSDQRYKPAVQ